MRRFVSGKGVGQVCTECIWIGFGGVAVEAGGNIEGDFQAVCMIELAAEGGDFGWKRAAEACAEYAFDNDVVTFFQTACQFL